MGLENFLPICRKMRNHWIYQDNDYYKVWSEMLFQARYSYDIKEGYYNGVKYEIGYGEFIFGRKQWAIDCNIAEGKLRRLIEKLIKEEMLEIKNKTNKFTVYKLVNYEQYNNPNFDQQNDHQMTSKRPAETVDITNFKGIVDQQMTSKPTSKPTTKEDRYNIDKDIYIIFNKWNELKVGIIHKDIKPIETEIKKAIKKYKINNILIAIERLDLAVKDKNYFYNQKWSLKNFLKQSNGIENWLDEGQYYNNYINNKKPNGIKPTKKEVNTNFEY